MIPYVQSAASQEVPPPYHFPGVTVNAFVCEADIARVQAHCDRFLNLGDARDRGFTYAPAAMWPYALLLFIDYPVMITSNRAPENIGPEAQYSDRGVVSQKEVFIAVPLVRLGTAPGARLATTTLEWALPFIVVGNPMSAVCGREMLGLEKLRAQIAFGEGDFPGSFHGQVSLPGWPLLDPDRFQRMLPFVEVKTNPVVPTFRGAPRSSSTWTLLRSRAASRFLDDLGQAVNFLDTATAGAIPTTMQIVSLKQFRDAVDPQRALYQALIGCRTKYSNVYNMRFYKEADVGITFHPQQRAEEMRGFLRMDDSGPWATFQPKAAFRFNADIDFDQMHTLHTFPNEQGPGGLSTLASSDLTAPWLRPWKGFFGPRAPS